MRKYQFNPTIKLIKMNAIKVQRALGTLTITEEKISELLDNLSIIESILGIHNPPT